MKKTSKMIMMVLVVMMFLCISVSASAETVLQFGTTVNEQDSFQVAAEKFAELVNERTDGAYVIEIYPNGTLPVCQLLFHDGRAGYALPLRKQ